ncbi:16S rRNA (cytidine(1402)-2'-O)-methyltransferase [Hippea jasoniae]|uniref:16S rRNA (cytidine(1402)-2'-O)-methyltransferase n=1 Tax=Hippea jasoniae TaxID=944479 RepID=UPI00068C173D|nr:16S rRNA (cytidine(1402)-2'-O)-methyltransferase [Hippea jasoniae]
MSGKLFVVATPIGNLKDITFRAVETLKSVDYILAESPHHSKRLLETYAIKTKTVKYNDDYNVEKIIEKAVEDLKSGLNIALISDAGTPTISDPGYKIVHRCRQENIDVVPVPGANAAIAAVSVSGLPTDKFVFLGFLPKGKLKKEKMLKSYDGDATIVLYESPHRILKTLNAIKSALGRRYVVVAREITKIHEEFISGFVDEVEEIIANKSSIKGEFVVLIRKADV